MQNVNTLRIGIMKNISALEGQICDFTKPNSFQIAIKSFADYILKRGIDLLNALSFLILSFSAAPF